MNVELMASLEAEYKDLETQLSDPKVIGDQNRFRDVGKRRGTFDFRSSADRPSEGP